MSSKTPNKADLLVYKALKTAISQDKLRIYLDYGKINRPQSPVYDPWESLLPVLVPVLIGLALIIGVGVIFGLLFIGVMVEVFSVYFKKKIYRRLIERTKAYLVSGIADSVVYFADKAMEDCHSIKLKSELQLTKGLAYAAIDRPDSLSHYFSPNIYNVKLSLRVKAFRAVSDMYDRMGNGREAHAFLKKYTLALDTLISDRKEEFMEKIHGIHEYKIQKDRANKAEMQAASNQLMFSNFVLAALLVILFLSVLLHYYRANRRKLTERLREETCLKMEEKIKRRDMEISLANKQEELRQKEIEKLNKNIDYYKQLNNVTLPIIMRRQNAQGALHLSDEDWNIIVGNADACFDMFSERLKKLCPQLTEDDIRFCCLVKMELSMSVLSEIYHIAKASISRRKMRLKEKIGIENVSFDEFIIGF